MVAVGVKVGVGVRVGMGVVVARDNDTCMPSAWQALTSMPSPSVNNSMPESQNGFRDEERIKRL